MKWYVSEKDMTENKVVIKINYDKSKSNKQPELQPKTVTEWRVGRIVAASVLLLSVVALSAYFLIGPSDNEKTGLPKTVAEKDSSVKKSIQTSKPIATSNVDSAKPVIGAVKEEGKVEPAESKTEVIQSPVIAVEKSENSLNIIETKSRIEPLINDARISRVVLAKTLSKKEPVSEISAPIIANKDKATAVFFFTEINNMKGEVLFHHWMKNGKSIFKRKINILGNRWRASTRKMITYSGKGHWVVRLVDVDGNILSEIQFEVV